MTTNKTIFTGLALLLILALAGCSGGGGKKKPEVASSENFSALAGNNESEGFTASGSDEISSKLLLNRAKIVFLKSIVEHGGQVFTHEWSHLHLPEWEIAPVYENFAFIGNAIFFEYRIFIEISQQPSELKRVDMQGDNETLIAESVKPGSVRVANDRIIYQTCNDNWETTGLYWYNTKTSKITSLLDKKDEMGWLTVESFDNDFVYYTTDRNSDVSRVRWNGTNAEVLQGVKMPKDLYKFEGDYYYCMDENSYNAPTEISRHSIKSGALEGAYTIAAKGADIKIEDGWAYFGDKTGFHKMNMYTGATVKLVDKAVLQKDWEFGSLEGVFGDNIYFTIIEDVCVAMLFKVPLNGGKIENQDMRWGVGCF